MAAQLDPELARLRTQDNRINQPAERLRRLDPGVRTVEGRGELGLVPYRTASRPLWRSRLMFVALNSRTGGGQIASNCRIVTLLMAPTFASAARSPRRDSMSLLDTVHLHQYADLQCLRQLGR